MDDDIDIYEDLHNFNEQYNGQNAEDYKKVVEECAELKRQVDDLTKKTEDLQKVNKTLEVNLSSLLKTAKAEIARKDRMIGELRKQVSDVTCRNYQPRERLTKENRSTPNTNVVNKQESQPIQPIVIKEELDIEPEVENYVSRYKKKSNSSEEPSKSSSTTIFSERLRKRIKEEEEAEQRQKKNHELSEDKEKQKIEKTASRNKENTTGGNVGNKENQSHCNLQNSNETTDQFRHPSCQHSDNTTNIEESNITNHQKTVLSKHFSGKRAKEDLEQPYNKRCKVDTESYSFQDNKYDTFSDDINSEKRNKMHFKEEVHISYSEKEITACHENHDRRVTSKSRSNDISYSRKEYSKNSYDHRNYSKTKESNYHEKSKYSRSWEKSPDPKYYDRKNRYQSDRHRHNRDRFDNRTPYRSKEWSPSNDSNRKHSFRDREKHRMNERYGSVDIERHQSQGSKCQRFSVSRSISRERSRSDSRERSVHRTYDRRKPQSTCGSNNSEIYKRKTDKIAEPNNESKTTAITLTEESVENKSSKQRVAKTLEDGEILETLYDDVSEDDNDKQNLLIKVESSVKQEESGESDVDKKKIENPIFPEQERVKYTKERIENCETNKDEKLTIVSNPNTDSQNTSSKSNQSLVHDTVLEQKQENNSEGIVKSIIDAAGPTINVTIKKQKNESIINDDKSEKKGNSSKIDVKLLKEENLPDIVPKCHLIKNRKDAPNDLDSTNVKLVELEAKTESNLSNSDLQNNETFISTQMQEETNVQPSAKENKENRTEDSIVSQRKTKVPDTKKETTKSVQNSNVIVLARRKKRVKLADNNASMTVVINTQNVSCTNNNNDTCENSALKARMCKLSRSYKDAL